MAEKKIAEKKVVDEKEKGAEEKPANSEKGTPGQKIKYTAPWVIIMWGIVIVALFFGAGGAWMTFSEITGAVIAQGNVKIANENKTVQHLEGGIIKSILVENGDLVEKGQSLVLLESAQVVGAVDQLQGQMNNWKIVAARLTAEKDQKEHIVFPAELKRKNGEFISKDVVSLVDAEEKLFASRREVLQNQLDLFSNQTEQINEQITSLQERYRAEEAIIALIGEELAAKEILYKDRFIEKTALLQLKRSRAERRGMMGQFKGAIAENKEKISAIKMEMVSLRNRYTEEAVGGLSKSRQEIFNLRDRLRPILDAQERLTIKAPIGGEVVNLQVHSVGGVLGPGEPILDLVPADSSLIIECEILVNDITHVYEGQAADVQLLAFNMDTPKIPGHVTYIAADRMVEKNMVGGAQAFYTLQIELDKEALVKEDLYLTAGMPASVFMLTKPRTVLQYAMEPLIDNFDRALREK